MLAAILKSLCAENPAHLATLAAPGVSEMMTGFPATGPMKSCPGPPAQDTPEHGSISTMLC